MMMCYARAEGRVFLLVPAYPGCPGTKAVKLLLLEVMKILIVNCNHNLIAISENVIDPCMISTLF